MRIPLLAVLLSLGCGATGPSGIGTSHAERPEGPVDLTLVTADGTHVELADQRGGIVLLFVTSTYDGVCQAAIRPVSEFTVRHLDVVVLAVIEQPDADTFADLYETTFEPPYTVAYEPEQTIALGTSDLGLFDAVPSFYILDGYGRVADTHVGWITDERLEAMYARAVAGGGVVAPEPFAPTPPASEPELLPAVPPAR